jgi:hypothetical protein
METKSKFIWSGIVVLAIAFAGFLWYQSYSQKAKKVTSLPQAKNETGEGSFENALGEENLVEEEMTAEDETDYNAICENGEWLKIADVSGEPALAAGKLRKVYPDDPAASQFKSYQYYLEGAESLGITGEKLFKLDYLEDREVEVQGVKNAAKKEVAIAQVKCTGKETDKSLLDKRKGLMNWLAANVSSVAPQKAKYQKWTVDIVDFVDESNVYVEYYDTVEDDESSEVDEDTSRRILAEMAPSGAGYGTKVLAYWEMGEDDYVLKTGTDKFENADTIASYQYDPEQKTWERID